MLRRFCVNGARGAAVATAGLTAQARGVATKEAVASKVAVDRTYHPELVSKSVDAYFALGLSEGYFNVFSDTEVAEHVRAFISATAAEAEGRGFAFAKEGADSSFWLCRSDRAAQIATEKLVEAHMERNHGRVATHAYTIRNHYSKNVLVYYVDWQPLKCPGYKGIDFASMTTEKFLKLRSPVAQTRYADIVSKLGNAIRPVYTIADSEEAGTIVLTIGFRPERDSYLTALTTLIHEIPGASVKRRFVESFAQGQQVYTLFVTGATKAQLEAKANLIGQLPNTPDSEITRLYNAGLISAEMVPFCRALVMFAFYFTPPTTSDDYAALSATLKEQSNTRRLTNIRNSLVAEIMSESYISQVLSWNIDLVKQLYKDFVVGHSPATIATAYDRVKHVKDLSPMGRSILNAFVTFNEAVVKHNYLKTTKAATAYRLDPTVFMKNLDFPTMPFGIFMFVGQQFRGFHVRFADIARGGVRLIVSKTTEAYRTNRRTLFQENYNLSHAQLLKNKDIPESGSKGTILLTTRSAADPKILFTQYVDALLDVILPNTEGVVDKLGTSEVIFLGPDENTAGDFPSHAALHAKSRGYAYWKSFTTGKGNDLGGIPHDQFAMTTESVRACLTGIYRTQGLKQEELTKFQTGGPDGDLGSNEILMGREKYVGITDLMAVVYDPDGLNRAEIVRLAKERKQLNSFNRSCLGPRGFLVLTSDTNVTLPDGTFVESGIAFRDTFYISKYIKVDVFVPCGGRPNSITLQNVTEVLVGAPDVTADQMFEGRCGNLAEKGLTKYKYISEGANLFITQDARIALENAGLIIIKDSTANKGGVTSSSIEVFAALALTDAEHAEHQCVKNDVHPKFYNSLVQQIVERVRNNATREFELIEREVAAGKLGGKRCLISDALSRNIVRIRTNIGKSDLFEDKKFVRYVLQVYTPAVLLEKVGVDNIMTRVPEAYLKAIFCMRLASDFVYTAGIDADEFQFFKYMHDLYQKSNAQ